jgi:drug/metabolite transporter (DMT)-like permease
MKSKSDRSAVILALISVICWSGAATAFKKALSFGPPWLVVFYASVISTAVFGIVLAAGKHRITRAQVVSGLYLGFLNPFLYYLVLLNAYHGLPAQIAMVVNYLWPVVLVLLSIPLLGQKLSAKGFTGVLLSFAGVVFLALSGGSSFSIHPVPLLLALASTLIWAVYWILNARSREHTAAVLFTGFVWGSVYLFVYGVVTEQQFSPGTGILPWILYVGVLEMGLTYILWNTALRRASTTAAVSSMIFLTPFLALIFIQAVVGEKIASSTVIGLVMVAGGIFLEKRSRRNAR